MFLKTTALLAVRPVFVFKESNAHFASGRPVDGTNNRIVITGSTLRISPTEKDDEGFYDCLAENEAGRELASAELTVPSRGERSGCTLFSICSEVHKKRQLVCAKTRVRSCVHACVHEQVSECVRVCVCACSVESRF